MQNKKVQIILIIIIVAISAGVIGFMFAKKAEAPAKIVCKQYPAINCGTMVVSGGKDAGGCELPPKCADESVLSTPPQGGIGQRACTQEAKLCSDGKTYVSRTGQNCEFTACP